LQRQADFNNRRWGLSGDPFYARYLQEIENEHRYYNAAITAINSAMWEQTTVLDNLIGKINKITGFFSVASNNDSASAKLSATWNLIEKSASNSITHSQGTYPLVTTMCSKTVAKATVMTDLVEAQEIYNRAMRRLYQASNGNTGLFSNIHKAWSVTTALQHFLTAAGDYTGKRTQALAAMLIPGSVTIATTDAIAALAVPIA
jgi:hypothetical protein